MCWRESLLVFIVITPVYAEGEITANSQAGWEVLTTHRFLPPDFDDEVFTELWTVWPEPERSEAERVDASQRRKMMFAYYGLMPAPGAPATAGTSSSRPSASCPEGTAGRPPAAQRALLSLALPSVLGARERNPNNRHRGPATMAKRSNCSVNLALQGGGAHGAFTWGVLDRLLEDGRFGFDGVSGTSAGAMNAVVLASGFEQDTPRHC